MSEYDQLKEKVAAQLQEKCGSMDVCAAMSALGVPLTATGMMYVNMFIAKSL